MAEQIKIFTLDNLTYYDSKLKVFIDEKLAEANAAIEAGDAKSFKAVAIEGNVLKFYRVDPITEEAVAAYEVTLPEQDLSHLMELVDGAVEGNVATFGAGGQVVDSGIKAEDIATKAEVNAVDAKADENKAAIDLINDLENGILKQAEIYADGKDAAIAAAQTAADEAQADVDALAEKVGEIPADLGVSTVIGYVDHKTSNIASDSRVSELEERVDVNEEAIAAIQEDYLKKADKDELAGDIADVDAKADEIAGKVDVLVGDDANKSVRTIANEELAKQLIAEGAQESLDTLGEIAAWIQSHPDDAAAMNKAIEDLEALVGTLPEGITATTLVGYIQEVVAAETAARELAMAGHEERIENLENMFEGENSVDAKIAAAKQEAIDAATEAAASDAAAKDAALKTEVNEYTDAELAKDRERLDVLEEATHTHANAEELAKIADGDKAKWDEAAEKAHVHGNAEVLEGITAEQVAAWDKAEENAIAKANELNEAMNLRVSTVEESLAEGGATANAIKKAQDDVDALKEKVGEIPADKTVVQMIEESVYDDTQVKADVAKNAEDLAALEKKHDEEKLALDGAIQTNADAIAALETKYVPMENSDIDSLFPVQTA